MPPPARAPQQRRQDALDRLERDVDAWVATADPVSGTPYLVPLSFLWDGATLLVATPASSPTSRNLRATGKVRLGIGPARDLVLIEGACGRWPPPTFPTRWATPSRPRPASTPAGSPTPPPPSASGPTASRPGARPTSSRAAS
jgi:Pyridoxamine 5'-phosphate oxidase